MIELIRSADHFKLTLLRQRLEAENIPCVILDEHSGTLMSGIGNILPRLMVLDEDFEAAKSLLEELEN